MILAIDIGNTTVALGGIRDGRVCFVARMDTVRTRTAAEYRAEMDKIFAHRRHFFIQTISIDSQNRCSMQI